MKAGIALILVTWLLVGCTATRPSLQALDSRAVGIVQAEIKRQIGVYLSAAKLPVTVTIDGKEVDVRTIPNGFMCGSGKIDFDVLEVKAELIATIERVGDTNLGLKFPWNGVTVGPSGEYKSDTTNAQVLDYNLWPVEAERQPAELFALDRVPPVSGAPIAQVLLDLRRALILSAMWDDYSTNPPHRRERQPCFTNYDPAKPAADAGHSYKVALTYVKDAKGGLEIKVGILDFTASHEVKATSGNTLTVMFVQAGLKDIQYARDRVTEECKYPNRDLPACQQAMAHLREVEFDKGGLGLGVR